MITAEMQRILLLVALAATAYLLVLAWNDDYIKGRAAPGASSGPVVTAPVGDAPDTFTEARQIATDVPKAATTPDHHDNAEPGRHRPPMSVTDS